MGSMGSGWMGSKGRGSEGRNGSILIIVLSTLFVMLFLSLLSDSKISQSYILGSNFHLSRCYPLE